MSEIKSYEQTTERRNTIEAYERVYREIEGEIAEWPAEKLVWKPAPASWSATEVLTHLADHGIVVSFRIREILAGTAVRLPAFDQDAWVSGQKGNRDSAHRVLAFASELVRYNARLLERLDAEEWDKSALNAKGDSVTVASAIEAFVSHVSIHLEQIRRAGRSYEAREVAP